MFQLVFRNQLPLEKAEEPEIKLPTSTGSSKKQEFQKNIYFSLLTMPKPLTVWVTKNCEKFWKRWEYQTTWPASWETCMQVKKQQLELDMDQQTGSKLGKEYIKAVYCHPAYLTYMQSTSWEMLGWKKHKLESRLLGEISRTWAISNPPKNSTWNRSPGEGYGNPLQYSCLEDPTDRGAWQATVHGVTKSRTQLND